MPTSQEHIFGLDARRVALVLGWFEASARDLPWRQPDCSAWGVLVSEVMLQQTPVARVLPAWEEWMKRWPTPGHLAAASQADAVRAWGRLGYPRRAKRLWECARVLVDRHGGEVPADADTLLSLPGVGDYTASAVRAFAFGERAVVLDTNVRRVLARVWGGEPLPATSVRAGERQLAERVTPLDPASAAAWAAASMELGALICTARAPRCEECPVASSCAWFAGGRQGLEEAPRRTQAWHGTDRQVRGRILALLREADAPLIVEGRTALADVEPGQVESCLESLLADGLVALVDAERGLVALA
ncbi:A/G-specific adenine glycosylase [Demequina lutea]|uniref:Adenine DNA glycosylase n=1 Tax=Demequina lutea TaxID=431489 RepID=A0A7Z0CLA2_9MICO|nr:A/G-specific adenine glycosylase [Demequina lutea]NYI42555.1 A/G-specific adenine glycosylase [Demequina lutea]